MASTLGNSTTRSYPCHHSLRSLEDGLKSIEHYARFSSATLPVGQVHGTEVGRCDGQRSVGDVGYRGEIGAAVSRGQQK